MRYVVLGYRDRTIEPRIWDVPSSLGSDLEAIGKAIASGGTSTVKGTGSPRLCSSGKGIGRGNILERMELGEGRVAFRSLTPNPTDGLYEYVHADHEAAGPPGVEDLGVAGMQAGALWMTPMEGPGEHEMFREIELGDTDYALETWKGLFVTAEGDGDGSPLTINRDHIGAWQRFHYKAPPKELLPEEPAEPTMGEQAVGTVDEAQTKASGIPSSPVGKVQDAQTDVQRPAGLRDKLFRRPGE